MHEHLRAALGKCAWRVLHNLGDANAVATLLEAYPCSLCREHLRVHMERPPPAQPGELRKWLFELHNRVNRSLGKRLETWPKDGAPLAIERGGLDDACVLALLHFYARHADASAAPRVVAALASRLEGNAPCPCKFDEIARWDWARRGQAGSWEAFAKKLDEAYGTPGPKRCQS